MSEQDESLRLAEMTPSLRGGDWGDRSSSELRRLHAEVNEQARLNGMGAERELALMAKVEALEARLLRAEDIANIRIEAATRARQQAQEALYVERSRCTKEVKRLQAEISKSLKEIAHGQVRQRDLVLDLSRRQITISSLEALVVSLRSEVGRLQAGGGEVVAWQASDGGHSFISHRTHTTNPDYRAVYTIPLCVATPQPEPTPVAATSAMVPMKLVEINDVGLAPAVIKPFTPAQRRRLWDNSKEHHKDAANITGFERIVTLTERAHGIGLTVGDTE